jgi:DNA-binding response OmpR family regulator
MSEEKIKILIIEDEPSLSSVLKTKLKKEGYEVEVAEDGEVGYDKIEKWKPGLILLDIVMPKMDGYKVLEKMRDNNIRVPVIVISNSGQPVELEKTKKLGAIDHLIKTQFEPREVIDKVKQYLNKTKKEDGGEEEEAAPKSEGSGKNQDVKVMIVEDDSFLRDLCVKELSKKGFTVYEAVDGEKALNLLEKVRPDIILLDIILPAVDGFDVLEKIKSNEDESVKNIPVLMLSNLGEKDDIKKAKDLGATDYLVKAHFTTKEITSKIKETLDLD